MNNCDSRHSRAYFEDGEKFSFYSDEQKEKQNGKGYCSKDGRSNHTFCFDGVVCGYYEFEDKTFILTKGCEDSKLFFAGLLDESLIFQDKDNCFMFSGNNKKAREKAQREFPVGSILSITVRKNSNGKSLRSFEVKKTSNKWDEHSVSTDFPRDVITLLHGLDFSCVFSGNTIKGFVFGPTDDNIIDVHIEKGITSRTFTINKKRDRLLCYPQPKGIIIINGYNASVYRGNIIIGAFGTSTSKRYFSAITPLEAEDAFTQRKKLIKIIDRYGERKQ